MSLALLTKVETDPFELYRQSNESEGVSYSAGFPHYPRNFSRDTINAGIIASSPELLASQLEISAKYQGQKDDPLTGERAGKIHHEFPGVPVYNQEKYTTYNACDTTSLFLIALEGLSLMDKTKATDFLDQRKKSVSLAVSHILDCVDDSNLFWEQPPSNEKGYALKVTYWKDSILPNANGKTEPTYPVSYSQVQFIAARALLSASRILNDSALATKADLMYKAGIKEFIQPTKFIVYRDSDNELQQSSSDELHSLAYIPKTYTDSLPLGSIQQRAKELATPFGYSCTPPDIARKLSDEYHGYKVWGYEQAMIHYAATKFNLAEVKKTAASVAQHIGEGQELLGVKLDASGTRQPVREGNDHQLWSKAASEYFAGRSLLKNYNWL